ncbi:MAG: IS66-like element accessory protein TnpA [Methyloligellaceae bacterium]
MSRRKRRSWSDVEKREICHQTAFRGVSVAQVARRYSMNANMIFKWLKDDRYAPQPEANEVAAEAAGFLPVEIEDEASSSSISHNAVVASVFASPVSAQRVDITLSDGRRILVEGTTALPAVLALVEGLIV